MIYLEQNKNQKMKKFQQWQDNQVYFIHLNNLINIKNRRLPNYKDAKQKQKSFSLHKENNYMGDEQKSNRILVRSIKTSYKPRRIKDKGRLSQQKLICDNLLLGKRILQTPSILGNTFRSKKKQIFKSETSSKVAWMERSWKLQHFRALSPEFQYVKGIGNNVLKIQIRELQCQTFKMKNCQGCHLSLSVFLGKTKRISEMVSVQNFLDYNFHLKFRRKLIGCKMVVKIRYHQGNSDLQVGGFELRVPERQNQGKEEVAQMFRQSGVLAGSANFIVKTFKVVNDFDKI